MAQLRKKSIRSKCLCVKCIEKEISVFYFQHISRKPLDLLTSLSQQLTRMLHRTGKEKEGEEEEANKLMNG